MRSSKRLSALALVVVAAGLSLTACGPDDSSASGPTSSDTAGATSSSSDSGQTLEPSSAPGQDTSSNGGSSSGSSSSSSSSGGSTGGSGTSGGSGSSNSGSMCTTSNLAITAEHGMSDEGMELVHLKNTGSSSCSMHGFAGVDMKNGSDTVSVPRYPKSDVPTVKLAPGETTDFAFYYPMNKSGGSGYTFTSLVITPPNETHSKTVSASINVPVQNPDDQGSDASQLYVLAVGSGE
jgi:hypothetical protein